MREDQNVRLLRTITFVCSGSPCRRHPMRADGRQRDAPHCYPWISSQDADDSPAPSADTPLTSLRDVKGRWVGRYSVCGSAALGTHGRRLRRGGPLRGCPLPSASTAVTCR